MIKTIMRKTPDDHAPSLEGKLTIIVDSQVNILLRPTGSDPTTREGMAELAAIAQRLATLARKPARIVFHDRDILTREFKPPTGS